MVSHDVTMLQNVCSSLWVCDNGSVEPFPGDVKAYKKRIMAQAGKDDLDPCPRYQANSANLTGQAGVVTAQK